VKPVAAVLFDAAGTLIETVEPVGESYARIAAVHGVALPAWRLGDAFARILRGAPPRVFPGATRERVATLERRWWREVVRATFLAADGTARFEDFEGFFEALFEHFAGPDAWRARAGAGQALDRLRERGTRTGVVSNFDARLGPILTGLGLSQRLDAVVLPIDAGAAKPDPAIFDLALARLGCPAGACVYVGDDSERDIAAVRRLGLRAIAVGGLATLAEVPERLDAFVAGAEASPARDARNEEDPPG
jgi:putative hydrolase of the HAD superfamily